MEDDIVEQFQTHQEIFVEDGNDCDNETVNVNDVAPEGLSRLAVEPILDVLKNGEF